MPKTTSYKRHTHEDIELGGKFYVVDVEYEIRVESQNATHDYPGHFEIEVEGTVKKATEITEEGENVNVSPSTVQPHFDKWQAANEATILEELAD